MEHLEVGKIGEDAAVKFLEAKLYKTIERNFRQPFGEIDIVIRAQDKTLVFVEVKTLVAGDRIKPEDNMTLAKIRKFKKIAAFYAAKNYKLINENRGWRIDVVAIEIPAGEWRDWKKFQIRHYENI